SSHRSPADRIPDCTSRKQPSRSSLKRTATPVASSQGRLLSLGGQHGKTQNRNEEPRATDRRLFAGGARGRFHLRLRTGPLDPQRVESGGGNIEKHSLLAKKRRRGGVNAPSGHDR